MVALDTLTLAHVVIGVPVGCKSFVAEYKPMYTVAVDAGAVVTSKVEPMTVVGTDTVKGKYQSRFAVTDRVDTVTKFVPGSPTEYLVVLMVTVAVFPDDSVNANASAVAVSKFASKASESVLLAVSYAD